MGEADRPAKEPLSAWAVHAFTATSAVFALLALVAIEEDRFALALVWLLAALVVDGIDGTFARAARVKERLPRIDGDALDLVVDYLTYVFVPALFIWRAGLVPAGWELPLAGLILLSSLYVFARRDMKTEDNYFRGFPALWSAVAFYLFVVRPEPWVGAVTVLLLVVATFAPVHFIHPFRVRDYGRWPPILAALWVATTAALLWPDWSEPVRTAFLAASLAAAGALIGMSALRTIRGPRPPAT
jgi:phosphatidylcholine synthase